MSDRELPQGWFWTTVGKITRPVMKVNPKEEPDARFTYLDISSIDNTTFRITAPKTYLGSEAPSRARQLVHANDVLFSTVRTYLKNLAMVPEVYDGEIASTGFSVLRAQNGVSAKYLFYYCLTPEFLTPLEQLQRGTSYPAVRDGDVREQPLPLAPLPEQHRIVAEIETHLTRLDAGVAALKRAQANLRRYRASVLKTACEGKLVPQDPTDEPAEELLKRILAERRAKWEADELAKMRARGKEPKDDRWKQKYKEPAPPDTSDLPELPGGWVWTSLNHLSSHVTSGSRGWAKHYADSGDLFLRVGNFNRLDTSLDLRNPVFVDAPDGPEADRTRLRIGDWLVTVTADVGMVAVVDEHAMRWGEAYINQHVGLVRPLTMDVVPFVAQGIASEHVQAQVRAKQYGATKKGLGLEDLKSLAVPLPAVAEQVRIVAQAERHLSAIKQLESAIETNLKRAGRLRQAILKHAFEGKLVPQDPADEPASVLLERIQAERAARAPKKQGRKKKAAPQPQFPLP